MGSGERRRFRPRQPQPAAVGAVATAEQFPGEGRVTGLALGATTATAVFGGFTPVGAQWLVQRTAWASAPGIMIAVVAVAVFPIFLTMRETAPRAPSVDTPTPLVE